MDETTADGLANVHAMARDMPRPTLGNQAVEVLVVGALKAEVATADVVDGLVVHHEGAVGVLERGVRREDRVVGLDDRGRGLGGGIDAELELALLAIVDREALHQQGAEARASATAERVEHQEALETAAVVGDAADLVEDLIDQLLADGVVTTRIVVGSVLLAGDHVFGVEKAAIGSSADLVNNIRLKVAVDRSRNVFSIACAELGQFWDPVQEGTGRRGCVVPVSEKNVLKPWSGSAALRSSVR